MGERNRRRVSPADGVIDPARPVWSRSTRKGELLRIRVDLHHDEKQVAEMALHLLALLPPERAVGVMVAASQWPEIAAVVARLREVSDAE